MKAATARCGCKSYRLWISVIFAILSLIYFVVATVCYYYIIPELSSYIGKFLYLAEKSNLENIRTKMTAFQNYGWWSAGYLVSLGVIGVVWRWKVVLILYATGSVILGCWNIYYVHIYIESVVSIIHGIAWLAKLFGFGSEINSVLTDANYALIAAEVLLGGLHLGLAVLCGMYAQVLWKAEGPPKCGPCGRKSGRGGGAAKVTQRSLGKGAQRRRRGSGSTFLGRRGRARSESEDLEMGEGRRNSGGAGWGRVKRGGGRGESVEMERIAMVGEKRREEGSEEEWDEMGSDEESRESLRKETWNH